MDDNFFLQHSIGKILELYKKKEISPVDIARVCINRSAQLDYHHVWEHFDEKKLLKQALESEKRLMKGVSLGALEGIPIGIKDIFNTKDFPTQMGSCLWKGFTPGNDARVVFNVKEAGAIIPGKTSAAEFGVHALSATLNPHNILKTPGTSSSGSAVGIALGMIPVALGSQTAGSIVRPASFCGVYGMKPSFGLIPRTGVLKTSDTLDSIGFFTIHFEDMERVLRVLKVNGADYPIANKAFYKLNHARKKRLRILVAKTHTWMHVAPYAKQCFESWINKLTSDSGLEVTEAPLPSILERAHEVHTVIYNKSLAYYFKKEYEKKEFISSRMCEMIEAGEKITLEEYRQALEEQASMVKIMDNFLALFDMGVSLSTSSVAPNRGEIENPDPSLMWTMTYVPVVSAPAFTGEGALPFGIQLFAKRYNDLQLLNGLSYLVSRHFLPSSAYPKCLFNLNDSNVSKSVSSKSELNCVE